MILVGIDEAGYGPTLGPLVVAGAAFRIPRSGEPGLPNLWKVLRRSTTKKPDGRRIPVNDSKKIYQSGKGIRSLEEGVLSFLGILEGGIPPEFRTLLRRLSGNITGDRYLDLYPWYRGSNPALPTSSYTNQIHRAAQRLREDLSRSGIELLGIRALPLEVKEFNRSLERSKNKAKISFQLVSAILRWIWEAYPGERIEVRIDRQGGRMRYGPLLYQKIRPRGIRIESESEEVSSYELCRKGPPMQVAFLVDCEEKWFPVALASMLCKYLRELHMSLFNAFWNGQIPHLKPTAGYYSDAQRFLAEISALRRKLAIDDSVLIRKR